MRRRRAVLVEERPSFLIEAFRPRASSASSSLTPASWLLLVNLTCECDSSRLEILFVGPRRASRNLEAGLNFFLPAGGPAAT